MSPCLPCLLQRRGLVPPDHYPTYTWCWSQMDLETVIRPTTYSVHCMSLYPHYVAPVAAFSHNTCGYSLKIEEVTFLRQNIYKCTEILKQTTLHSNYKGILLVTTWLSVNFLSGDCNVMKGFLSAGGNLSYVRLCFSSTLAR